MKPVQPPHVMPFCSVVVGIHLESVKATRWRSAMIIWNDWPCYGLLRSKLESVARGARHKYQQTEIFDQG